MRLRMLIINVSSDTTDLDDLMIEKY